MEGPQATIAHRSYSGCRTCRLRKVKCDEIRDIKGSCGSCARLNRQCDWTRQWKFIETNSAVESQYSVVKQSLNSEDGGNESADTARSSSQRPTRQTPKPLETRCTRSCVSCSSRVKVPLEQGLVFVNSFSDNFAASRPNRMHTPSSVDGSAQTQDDRQFSELSDDGSDSRSVELVHSPPSPPIHIDFMDYGTRSRDNLKHPFFFDTVVCPKIMPMAVRFRLNIEDNRNVLLTIANEFAPLKHAVCAITLLNSGLKGRPELIAGSFQHYDRAISACRSTSSSTNPEAIFFLHFVLLMYDIACASQRWPEDRSSWALHLRKLASLAHDVSSPTVSRLKAYLSWYILLLDSQAGLAGNQESGHFAQTFLDSGRSLPLWPITQSQEKTFSSPDSMHTFIQAHKLTLLTFEMFAEQSQVSLAIRRALKEQRIDVAERLKQVQKLSDRHRLIWETYCPPELLHGKLDVPSADRRIVASTFNFARLQFSILSLHLHTSMYPRQRLDGDTFAQEDAEHCSYIIETVLQSFVHNDRENHHLAGGLFLAGAMTKSPIEKYKALKLLEEMEHAGITGAVSRVRHFLELVVKEQAQQEASGGSADDVDWIELSQELGLKNVVFGM